MEIQGKFREKYDGDKWTEDSGKGMSEKLRIQTPNNIDDNEESNEYGYE